MMRRARLDREENGDPGSDPRPLATQPEAMEALAPNPGVRRRARSCKGRAWRWPL